MINGTLKENLQKLSQMSSQGIMESYSNQKKNSQGISNVNNENSHLSINPEYLSSLSEIENIREFLFQNSHVSGALDGRGHYSSGHPNDSLLAVRDYQLPPDDRDSIYDILDPHNVRRCLEESK